MRTFAFLILSAALLTGATPSEALLLTLEKARVGELGGTKLEDLAISPQCGSRKLRLIGEQWQNLGKWARASEAKFVVIEERIDEDLAAVIVAGGGDELPGSARVLGYGLRLLDGGWKVTPIDGRFANAGLGFERSVIGRAQALEKWMSTKLGSSLLEYRNKRWQRYLQKLAAKVDLKKLKAANAEEAFSYFQVAVREGNEDETLAWLGMLERTVEDEINWRQITKAVKAGLVGADKLKVWRLLKNAEVIRLVVSRKEGAKSASYLLGLMAPYTTGLDRDTQRVIRFNLKNTPAGWRLELPAFFAYANESSSAHYSAHREEFDWEDQQHTERITSLFEEQQEARRGPTAEKVLKDAIDDINKKDYRELLRFLYRAPKEAEGKEIGDDLTSLYAKMGNWWKEAFGDEGQNFQAKISSHFIAGEVALGVILVESLGSWKPEFKTLWLLKGEDGWAIVPSHSFLTDERFAKKYQKDADALRDRFKNEEKGMQENYLKNIFTNVPSLAEKGEAVDEVEAKKIAFAWRAKMAKKSVMQLLSEGAVIEAPERPARLMQDMVAAMKGVSAAKNKDLVIGTKAVGKFHALSMMVDAGRGVEMHCPLLLVAPTEEGPRILADLELWLPSNRGKRIRNDAALIRIKKILSKDDYAAIQKLFKWHEEIARPVWEEWQKNKEE